MKLIDKLNLFKFPKRDLFFVLLIGAMAIFYCYKFISAGPLNVHTWRQTDCLSMTHYYSEGASFWKPQMHTQLSDKFTDGLSAGEFPILYYVMGKYWHAFGESYLPYRLFCLALVLIGLFAFYKGLRLFFDDFALAVIVAALLFTSPTLVVYSANFLTDAPAFSFMLIALYFLLLYTWKDERKWLFVSMAFFALGGLIKVSSLMVFLFLFFIFLLENLSFKSLRDKKFFHVNRNEWAGFLSVFVIVISWYGYAHYYNTVHEFKFTPNSIYPLWILNAQEMQVLKFDVINFASLVFYSRPVLLLLLIGFIANLFLWKKIPPFAYIANIILLIGSVLYFILWAPLLGVHDYYYVALLVLFLSVFLPFLYYLKKHHSIIFHSKIFKGILLLFLVYNFIYCKAVVDVKTWDENNKNTIVGNKQFVDRMHWANWEVRNLLYRYAEMKTYMAEIGIRKEDKIISVPDFTPNTTLYLTGHEGWTGLIDFKKMPIDMLMGKGAKYLLVGDDEWLQKEFLQQHISNQVGEYKGIRIYKL